MRQPVITGTGIICSAGCGIEEVWDALRSGRSGLGSLTLFSSSRYSNHLVGQVRQDVDALAWPARGSRSDKLTWIAARQALKQAGLTTKWPSRPFAKAQVTSSCNPTRLGVAIGSTVAGMLGSEQCLTRLFREGKHRFGPLRFHPAGCAADLCARILGALGPCATFSTACSAGAMAIAAAADWIEQGEADLVLAGGGDSLSRLTLNGFGSLLLLDPNGCRPFDARRTGISLGEGAAMLVIESEEHARGRGATVLARLAGWGASCDAWHATSPHPEGNGAFNAMRAALQRAGLQPAQIDYVSAHGTGTPDNDAAEARALRRLFGESLPPVASLKRYFGHTLAASGAIKAVANVQALREQAMPPSLGFEQSDPRVGLEPLKEFRTQHLSRLLSNSFGFGGNNVALVFASVDCEREFPRQETPRSANEETVTCRVSSSPARQRFAVLASHVISPAGSSPAEIQAAMARGGATPTPFEVAVGPLRDSVPVFACGDFGAGQSIDSSKRRRLNRIQQMVLVAARRSVPVELAASTVPERICVALGTGFGLQDDTAGFVENMVLHDERAPRPQLFTNSVHNALASQVAIDLKIAGLNSTPVQREISFEIALAQGARQLALGLADLALVGAADELNKYPLAAGLRWGWWRPSSLPVRPFESTASEISPLTPALSPSGGEGARRGGEGEADAFTVSTRGMGAVKAHKARQRPLAGEGCGIFTLARDGTSARPLAWVNAVRIGRFSTDPAGRIDAAAEARWILETLERDGESLEDIDVLLTGASGWTALDEHYRSVAEALSQLACRSIACAAYKHACGEFDSASAIGFSVAIGLVRGEIHLESCLCESSSSFPSPTPCRAVLHYSLASSGNKGMCCLRA